jgi:ABC-2 type transport system permease protein
MGWHPHHGVLTVLLGLEALLLGTAAFASLGLLVAGTLRAEATLAAANLIYLLLMAGGAVVLPAKAYGGAQHLLTWLPSGALGEAVRGALIHGSCYGRDQVVLLAWAVVGTVLTARTFRWE